MGKYQKQVGLWNRMNTIGDGNNINNNNNDHYGPVARYNNRALGTPNYIPTTSVSPYSCASPTCPSYASAPFNIPVPVPQPQSIPMQTFWPGLFMYEDDYNDFDSDCCSTVVSHCCHHGGGGRRSKPMRGFGWNPLMSYGGFGGFGPFAPFDWLRD